MAELDGVREGCPETLGGMMEVDAETAALGLADAMLLPLGAPLGTVVAFGDSVGMEERMLRGSTGGRPT